jgi:hypothetical protein
MESYLLDHEVLDALCEARAQADKKSALRQALADAVSASVNRGNDSDDLKSAAGEFVVEARRLLGIRDGGNDTRSFLRDTVAPCVRPGMVTYDELRVDVFGDG